MLDREATPVVTLTVTASVTQAIDDVQEVLLYYRAMYEQETAIPMADDGIAPDVTAADGIFTATIPSAVAGDGGKFIAVDDVLAEIAVFVLKIVVLLIKLFLLKAGNLRFGGIMWVTTSQHMVASLYHD